MRGEVAGYVKSDKPSPFGAARPREEILKSKGVDYKKVEEDLAKRTAKMPRMTREQQEELKAARAEVAFAQETLKNAETDDERKAAEAEVTQKEKEIAEMVESFKKVNLEKRQSRAKEGGKDEQQGRPFIRPSERRRMRQERERMQGGGQYGSYNNNNNDLPDAFKNQRRGGGQGDYDNRNSNNNDFPSGFQNSNQGRRGPKMCFDYQKGMCTRGASCRYEPCRSMHGGGGFNDGGYNDRGFNNGGNRAFQNNGGRRGPKMCFDYQKGMCTRGASCRYEPCRSMHGGGDGGYNNDGGYGGNDYGDAFGGDNRRY